MGEVWETRLCVMTVMMHELCVTCCCLCSSYYILYCELPKYAPPFFSRLFWSENGERAFARIFSAYAPSIPCKFFCAGEVNNYNNCHRVLEEQQFAERILWKISDACVQTKPSGIEATCIISDDKGHICSPSASSKILSAVQWVRL